MRFAGDLADRDKAVSVQAVGEEVEGQTGQLPGVTQLSGGSPTCLLSCAPGGRIQRVPS